MKLPFPFHALQNRTSSLGDADKAEEEYRFIIQVLWFIESVVNQNYQLELETVSEAKVVFLLDCAVPKGKRLPEAEADHKNFRGELHTVENGYACLMKNIEAEVESFAIELIKETRPKKWLMDVVYQNINAEQFVYQVLIGPRPPVIAQPFVQVLKRLGVDL
jgi:hypothetical protein